MVGASSIQLCAVNDPGSTAPHSLTTSLREDAIMNAWDNTLRT